MPILSELKLAKELIRFPSITPVDAGTMNFLARKFIVPASTGVILGNLISSLANFNSLNIGINLFS